MIAKRLRIQLVMYGHTLTFRQVLKGSIRQSRSLAIVTVTQQEELIKALGIPGVAARKARINKTKNLSNTHFATVAKWVVYSTGHQPSSGVVHNQMKTMMSSTESRFKEFARLLKDQTGDKAILYRGVNSVAIEANGFSPKRSFRSVQAAIDEFAHLLPTEFVTKGI